MTLSTGLPFDDIRGLLPMMPPFDDKAAEAAAARLRAGCPVPGSLGRLADLAVFMAGWQGKPAPTLDRPLVCVFASTHGFQADGTVADAQARTRAVLDRFAAGTAAINQVCAAGGLGFKAFDLALDLPTGDITVEAALNEKACVATMAFGMEALAGGIDLLCLGDVSTSGEAPAAAVLAALFGGQGGDWLATGGNGAQTAAAGVDRALGTHAGGFGDPLEVLRRLGGRDMAALVGAILAARLQRIPVILDGFVAATAAAVLHALDPGSVAHCLAGQVVPGGTHEKLLDRLGLRPVLDLELAGGEGTGAAIAASVVKAAVSCLKAGHAAAAR